MFSLICVWIYGWVNNREAGDLRLHRGHYDVIVMQRVSWRSHCSSLRYLWMCHFVRLFFSIRLAWCDYPVFLNVIGPWGTSGSIVPPLMWWLGRLLFQIWFIVATNGSFTVVIGTRITFYPDVWFSTCCNSVWLYVSDMPVIDGRNWTSSTRYVINMLNIWKQNHTATRMWNMISSPATPTVCLEQKCENFQSRDVTFSMPSPSQK